MIVWTDMDGPTPARGVLEALGVLWHAHGWELLYALLFFGLLARATGGWRWRR